MGLELVIGLVGASLVFALPEFPKLLGPMLGGLASIPWLLNLVRLTMAFAVLVIPATAMGATLPVLVHALTRVEPNFGASLGRLYGWNTLGAMLGSLAGGFILLPVVGMENSFFLLAAAYGVTTLIVPGAERAYNRLTMLARPAAIVTLAACLVLFPFGLMQQAYFGILATKLHDHELVETRA